MSEEINWNVSFRLSRKTRNREMEEEYSEHGSPFDESVIAGEIITWLEDLGYRVNDLQVKVEE